MVKEINVTTKELNDFYATNEIIRNIINDGNLLNSHIVDNEGKCIIDEKVSYSLGEISLNLTELKSNLIELSTLLDSSQSKDIPSNIDSFFINKKARINLEIPKGSNVIVENKDNYKKITNSVSVENLEVESNGEWIDVEQLHETIEYQVFELKLSNGKTLKCADKHIVILTDGSQTFVDELKVGDKVITDTDSFGLVESVTDLGYKEKMYDLELKSGSSRTYFTNGILSHNTHLAKLLAENLFSDSEALIRIDMSEYMDKHSVSKLVGPPPGYVGYEEGGQLTEKVRRKPYAVVLFDEIEKAHPDVFNILLQLLDEGHLTDGLGRKVNFKNCLIILTSNVGISKTIDEGNGLGFTTSQTKENNKAKNIAIINKEITKSFKPEFLNRLDEIIHFNNLSTSDVSVIVSKEFDKLKSRLIESGYEVKINKAAIEYLAIKGYNPKYGARPVSRAIEKYVEGEIADNILNGVFSEGDTIKITYNKKDDKLVFKK